MKKKIAAFVLATALVLPVSVPAFAATTPSDVVGKPVQSSVEELTALGIIQGYEDGTFKPENQITRAELAKIIVIASGNESAANLMAGVKPAFTDVKASQWYTGYINAAAAKGYIVGYNGKFRPSDSVKFEEVVAILVRSLGYKESQLSGAWPYNYLLAAQDTKDGSLFEGLDITPGTTANRGIVARLTSNTINAKTVTYTGINGDVVNYGDKLVTKIGETSTSVVTSADLTKDKEISLEGALVKTSDKFVVTGGKALADLVGHTVTVVKTKDKKQVLAVTDAQATNKIVAFENNSTAAADTVGYSVYLTDKNAKTYTTAPSTKYLGFTKNFSSTSSLNTNLAAGEKATLFLNADDQVQYVTVVNYTENQIVSNFEAKTPFRDARFNLKPNGSVSVKDTTSIKLNGVAATTADIKEDDIIRYVNNGTNAVVLEATRNVVTGKVEKVKTEGTKSFYTVAGKEYEAVAGLAALTLNNEYSLLLNHEGKIASSKAASANTSSNYAIAIKTNTAKVAIIENNEVTAAIYNKLDLFSAKENKNIVVYLKDADLTGTVVDNSIVKLTFNADGKVTKAAVVANQTAAAGPIVKDVTATTITTTTNSTYYVNSNTVYLDASNRGNDVIAVSSAAKVTKNDVVSVVLNSTDLVTAELVVLVSDSDSTSTETTVRGTFISKYIEASGNTTSYFVSLNVKGTATPFAITETAFNAITANDKYEVVTLTDLVGGKYNGQASTTTAVQTLSAVTSSNSTFKADNVDYIVTPNTVVYALDKDNNLTVDTFGAITSVDGGTIGTDFDLYVVASDNSVSTFKEAAVVVVKKK